MRPVLLLALLVAVAAVGFWLVGGGAEDQPPERDRPDASEQPRASPTLKPGGDPRYAEVAASLGSATATGHVMDRGGRPVAGARVTWAPTRGGEKTTVLTAPDGTFRIEETADSIDLWVVAPNGRRARLWCVSGEGREPFWIRVQDVARLRGTVRSEMDGAPVAGAKVTAWGSGFGTVETRTTEGGTFELDVPRHIKFSVKVEAESRGRRVLRDVAWGPHAHLEVTLPKIRTLHGRVVRKDDGGATVGVSGVHVRSYTIECTYYGGISGHPLVRCGQGVETAADGSFTYEGLTRSGLLYVLSDAWEFDPSQDLYRGACSWYWDKDLTFVVRPKEKKQETREEQPSEPAEYVAYVQGEVFEEGGGPIQGAEVRVVWIESLPRRNDLLRFQEGRTDARGHFRLDGLPESEVDLRVSTPGYDTRLLDDLRPSRDGTVTPPIRLQRLVPVVGRVIGAQGNPVATASYGVSSGRPRSGRPVDPEGRFRIEVPRDGDYTLTVEAPGFLRRKLKRAERAAKGEWRVTLVPAPLIQGRVLDTHGNPVCPARVGTDAPHWIRTWDGASTAPDGTFRLEVPEPGTYCLEVEAEGMIFRPKRGVETGTTDTVIRAVLPCSIAGRVVGPPGVTLPRMVVEASPEDDGDTETDVTDADGRFRVEGLAGETFRLHVRFNDDDLIARGLLVTPLEGVPAWSEDVVLEATYGEALSGTVVWPDDTPAAGVFVDACIDVDGFHVPGKLTNEDGTFAFHRILPGRYEIHASESVEVREPDEDDDEDEGEYLEYASDTVEVEAGSRGIRLRLRLRPNDDE